MSVVLRLQRWSAVAQATALAMPLLNASFFLSRRLGPTTARRQLRCRTPRLACGEQKGLYQRCKKVPLLNLNFHERVVLIQATLRPMEHYKHITIKKVQKLEKYGKIFSSEFSLRLGPREARQFWGSFFTTRNARQTLKRNRFPLCLCASVARSVRFLRFRMMHGGVRSVL
jgi:hypothetical protein